MSTNMAAVLLLALAGAASPTAMHGNTLPQGTVTVTKARGDAAAIWDATAVLTALIGAHDTKERVTRELQADAVAVLVDRAGALRGYATSITITVLYAKTGAISPAYHVATFEGVERYMLVKATVTGALANGTSWESALRVGHPARGLTIMVVGSLPPELK
ncbi:MAG: hypothetical protein ACYC8W_03460 [Candidatus Tyrphobacter sp.]